MWQVNHFIPEGLEANPTVCSLVRHYIRSELFCVTSKRTFYNSLSTACSKIVSKSKTVQESETIAVRAKGKIKKTAKV